MARLFTSAVGRDPIPAPAGWIERRTIPTHPESASAGQAAGAAAPASLHDRLFAAWGKKDWAGLAAVARGHLQEAGLEPRLHPIAAAAIAFFRPSEVMLRPGDAERFLAGFPEGQFEEYRAKAHGQERSRLADGALALHCLGLLGEARFDYVGAIRSLEALAAAADLWDRGGERRLSPALINGIGEYHVALPDWAFDLDLCCHSGSEEGWPTGRRGRPTSPTEEKIAAVAVHEAGARGESCCECGPEIDICLPQDPCCAHVHYYIADLLELRDWTHGYIAGELAYIENIAAGETRWRKHGMKLTSELAGETETSARAFERRDFQVAARASVQVEIEKRAQESTSGSAGFGGFALGPFSFGGGASASFAQSASAAFRIAHQAAIETVHSAVSEIEKETRTLHSARLKSEETEKNRHRFRNDGEAPKVTKYFWVTQKRCAQLFSYGRHLLAEFIVPEPARLLERLLHERCEAEIGRRLKPPARKPGPPEFKLRPQDLGKDNYEKLARDWGVADAPAWPPPTMEIKQSAGYDVPAHSIDAPLHFDIPDGYEAFQMTLAGTAQYWHGSGWNWPYLRAFGPGVVLDFPLSPVANAVQGPISPRMTGGQDILIRTNNTSFEHIDVTLHLARKAGVLEAWQAIVFKALQAKYEQALAAYAGELGAYADYEAARDKLRAELLAARRSQSPLAHRALIATEIKRAVIYLMCQDFSVDGAMIRRAEPCGFPEIDRTAADRKGYDWYFWDRLIDWKQMAYAFFDYFWNPMCDWPERFDPDEPDPLFKAFRRAGYARVLVPVSPAMQADFLWYVTTHQKWGQTGLPPLNPADPRWRNVVYELHHANELAMTRREGHADVGNGDPFIVVKGSDRYWDPGATPTAGMGNVDAAAIALDLDRELFIECEAYLITGIAPEAGSPSYDPAQPDSMWWRLTLDRPYEGATGTGRLYAVGAQAVAPKFSFELPTELVWAGAHDECLPTYPLPPCPP